MKNLIITIFLTWNIASISAQTNYDKIGQFGEYKSNWALVQVGNKFGFINDKGKEIVKPIYDKIGSFGEYKSDWAFVILNGKEGFIDKKGNFVFKNE